MFDKRMFLVPGMLELSPTINFSLTGDLGTLHAIIETGWYSLENITAPKFSGIIAHSVKKLNKDDDIKPSDINKCPFSTGKCYEYTIVITDEDRDDLIASLFSPHINEFVWGLLESLYKEVFEGK